MRRVVPCKGCGAAMFFARTGRGKKVPLDAEPTSAGCFVVVGDDHDPFTYRLANDAAPLYADPKYTSHFETCPNAKDFSNRGKR